jgi:hypothetical protein
MLCCKAVYGSNFLGTSAFFLSYVFVTYMLIFFRIFHVS